MKEIEISSSELAGEEGFEPSLAVPETAVLPLDDSPAVSGVMYMIPLKKRTGIGQEIFPSNLLTFLPTNPYNGGKTHYPLISLKEPITARFVVRVHIGELPDYYPGYSRVPLLQFWQENRENKVEVNPMNNRFFIDSALSKIPSLSPQHQELVANLVEEFAKMDGVEATASPPQSEPLARYIPAWQNSLGNESYSPGTMDLYRHNVERFFANVRPPYTTIAIEAYIASRRESRISPTAVKNDLKAIKNFFGFLLERDIIASDPTAKLKHPKIMKEEKVCPKQGEMAKFLAVLAIAQNPKAKLMLSLFINTGIRFDELVTLTWGKVNLEQCQITVLGKGRKWRTVPISYPLRDFLAELRNGHTDGELLFPTESKKGKWDNSDANKMIARLCRRAGIRKYSCHQFRHYFATYLQKAGVRIKVVQELLGHAQASTTFDFYDHTDEEEVRKAHEAFAPLLGEVLMPKKDKKGGSDHG